MSDESMSGTVPDLEAEDAPAERPSGDPSEVASRAAARDAVLVESLGAGASYSEAAELAGCSSKTVGRRMADESFRAAVEARRLEWTSTTAGLLNALGPRAAAVLDRLLDAEDDDVRLRAARETLAQGQRSLQLHELKGQLALLRTELNELRRVMNKGATS